MVLHPDGMSTCGRCGQSSIYPDCHHCAHEDEKGRHSDAPVSTAEELEGIADDLSGIGTADHSEAFALRQCERRLRHIASRMHDRALDRLGADIASHRDDVAPAEAE